MCHKKRRYTSDLSAVQWLVILPLLVVKRQGAGRPIEIDLREAVNGMMYIAKTGCQWANLPTSFPNPNRVYYHYRKWCEDGTWERINRLLRYTQRRAAGRSPHPSAAILDSQSVKTSERGGPRGYDGGKRIKGRKRHILVDTQGNVLALRVLPADIQDRQAAYWLLAQLPLMLRLRLAIIWADRAYDGTALVGWCHDQLQLHLQIVAPPADQKGFVLLPKRWIVERTFAWFGHYRRLSKDFEQLPTSSEGMIYLAVIHALLKRLAP